MSDKPDISLTPPISRQTSLGWTLGQAIGFQAFWLVAILGGNHQLLFCLILLAIHFGFSPTPRKDIQILSLALIGITIDFIFTVAGVFSFSHTPWWLGAIWLAFVLTLGHSMRWLRRLSLVSQSIVGAISATASYMAGWRLEAVELPLGMLLSAILIASVWALLLPSLITLDKKLRGQQ